MIEYIYYETKYVGMDSEDFYKKNLEMMPDDWHYRTKKITYKINSFNYRVTKNLDELKWQDSVVIIGCSNIFGIGVADDETLPFCLELLINRPVINMGMPGASNELILNNCSRIIENYDAPYAIIVGWTEMYRFMYYIDNKQYNIAPWIIQEKTATNTHYGLQEPQTKVLKKLYIDRSNNKSFIKNKNISYKKTIKAILKNRTKFYDFSVFLETAETLKCPYFVNNRGARDFNHVGYDDNKIIAQYLAEKLSE